MRIAVCFKVTPDTAQLRADPQTGAPRLDQAPPRVGTFDENALEEAVLLKERRGGEIIAVTLVAEAPPPELLLRVLAIGVDEVYVIQDPTATNADALATARILGTALKKLGELDVVLCGEGSLDAYNRQVGARLAEALGFPMLSHVTQLQDRGDRFLAHRALEDRTAIVEISMPALFSVGQEINEPRFPTVLQIMAASRKPTVTWKMTDLGFDAESTAAAMSGVETLSTFAPPDERKRIAIEGDCATSMARNLAETLFECGLVKVE